MGTMYYIKCTNCGKYNEVKNEYLTFCESCNAKLENNFTQWKARNPLKKLEDFQSECCVAHEQVIRETIPRQTKKKRIPGGLAIFLIILLVFSALGVVGYFVAPHAKNLIAKHMLGNKDAVIEKLAEGKWERQELGSLGLSIASPLPLSPNDQMKNSLPPQLLQVIQKMETYAMNKPMVGIMINCSSIAYNPNINISLAGAKSGALEMLKQTIPGASDFNSGDNDYSINGMQGILTKGSFTIMETSMGFQMLNLKDKNVLYVVSIIYDGSGNKGEEFANRFIESAKIMPY